MDRLEYAMKLHEKIAALDMAEDDRPPMLDMLLALPENDLKGMKEAYDRMSAEGKERAKDIAIEVLTRLVQRRKQ